MTRRIYIILSLLLLSVTLADAQNIRYVSKEGKYEYDGQSWATAKSNIQDAINDLVNNGLTGEVWVAAGKYTPTESTETSGGSTLYMSFKIPAGISVYGGFAGDETTRDARATREYSNGDWEYTNQTILMGDLSTEATFEWNSTKNQYTTTFYGNCYHVVWFATNGFDDDGRAVALDTSTDGEALLEGCYVKGGNAHNTTLTGRSHNAYGGGIYMVEGSRVKNCRIYNCEASRDGGAVYMDGGGVMEHCYVFDSQALGISLDNGYGGGVCIDANTSATAFGIERSYISGCVARMGGGLSIQVGTLTGDDGVDMRYMPYASAVAVVNNIATTEGGGVYTNGGGVMTQMTIANNVCNGSGVTINDIITGRSAGLYCRDAATVLNSVLWGGECSANNDIQYASSRSTDDNDYKVTMKYCQVAKSGYVDWSSTKKMNITPLASYNTSDDATSAGATVSSSEGYPQFEGPSSAAGYIEGLQDASNWQPTANSSLCNAGIMAIDLDTDGLYPFTEASVDIHGDEYTPHATLGAYVRETATAHYYVDNDGAYCFFVDPDASSGVTDSGKDGSSWDTPIHYLSTVFHTIEQSSSTYGNQTVNIYVKEGTLYNTNPFYHGRLRTLTIDVPSNVNIYGGYSSELTGTSLDTRNPRIYQTIISGSETEDFSTNVAHLVTFDAVENVVFDGFQIRYANATSTVLGNDENDDGNQVVAATDGAAMRFINGAKVTVKNTLIADCQANKGAAIYTSGGCEISFENCIIHNNTSTESGLSGIIYSEGADVLTFTHCDIMRNVGYAAWIGSEASHEYTNCIFYANMSEVMDETTGSTESAANTILDKALTSFVGSTDVSNVSGSHCFFDSKSADFGTNGNFDIIDNDYQYALSYVLNGDGYPRFINPTSNAGVSEDGDVTRYGRSASFQPHNDNPIVNEASYSGTHDDWGTDMSTVTTRDYGGLPDVGAIENHAATTADEGENAYTNGQAAYGSVIYVRDYNTYEYGDDGSITCTATDESTTHNGTSRDGSSWTNAINGNALYEATTTPTTKDVYEAAEFTSISSVNNAKTTDYQYKLGITYDGTTYYVYYNTSSSAFELTTDVDDGDLFVIIATGSTGIYRIYDVTTGSIYLSYSTSGSQYTLTGSTSNSSTWTISSSNTTYTISISTYYLQYNDGSLQLSTTNSDNSWTFYLGEEKDVDVATGTRGLQYAINQANEAFDDDRTAHSVYVGGGVYGGTTGTEYEDATDVTDGQYAMNLTMKDGVNVYGGFPRTGNPGTDERNISNLDTDDDGEINYCRTYIDANESGRVVTQDAAFTVSSMLEGFIIQNGVTTDNMYGAGVYLLENGILKNCIVQNNIFNASSNTNNSSGGGGVYIGSGGIVQNCIVRNNETWGKSQSIYTGGAGVFSAGGTLQNSLIVENTSHNTAYNILGAGLYISSTSELYNCTIAYNVGNGPSSRACTGGVWDNNASWNSSTSSYDNASQFYNCIIWGNYGTGSTVENYYQVGMSGFTNGAGLTNDAMHDCYSSAAYSSYASDDATDTNKVCIMTGATYYSDSGVNYETFYSDCLAAEPFYRDSDNNTDYSLKSTATQCINMGGSETTLEELGIIEDIIGADRIQDCTVDKGAYEYNDSYAISPDTSSDTSIAAFYVTPEGNGTASAENPANAACASKLQKVLDAAGRYKFRYPNAQVVVKVANSSSLAEEDDYFQYYANRSTDIDSDETRIWSIIVPRGVEVWGGYSDSYTDENTNGFYIAATDEGVTTYKDQRNILGNPTYFDAAYYNSDEKSDVTTYHVVTFTDQVFDANGKPYLATDTPFDEDGNWNDSGYTTGTTATLLSMTDTYSGTYGGVTDRAVVDGIFITGGLANLNVSSSTSSTQNINRYGGGAIVTDYAHVRNCILRDNEGTYGGALALTHGALVSGCLIDQNTADYGGAIYVFADGTNLSDGTEISTSQGNGATLDANMPHVYTSTIVNNAANKQGGGVWFSDEDANVRFNSTVVWQNDCQDQANVSGLYNITKPSSNTNTVLEFYPFNYCAIQNLTLMGLNNIDLGTLNKNGARFHKHGDQGTNTLAEEDDDATGFEKFSDFGYYGLTNYSVLACSGMPEANYETLIDDDGLATDDFTATSRTISGSTYIDIGARAFDKEFPSGLMLRIFVAKPDDVDVDAAYAMMNSGGEYYSMEGSSFAYPMMHLQDALDYIASQRELDDEGGIATEKANELPFEIIVARGTYYPMRDLTGQYTNSVGNTYLIPEGVSIYGGFNVNSAYDADGEEAGDNVFYGAGYEKNTSISTDADSSGQYFISQNVAEIGSDNETTTITDGTTTYTIYQLPTTTLTKYREHTDINANSIIEPWEFTNQTILSGLVGGAVSQGVNHVVTLLADQNDVGAMPTARNTNSDYVARVDGTTQLTGYGYTYYEMGQAVTLDGLTITGGYAYGYQEGSVDDKHKLKYNQGGGVMVDGNRYCDDYHKDADNAEGSTYKHHGISGAVGYRDLHLVINKCKFEGNAGGFGGAISSNGTIDIFNSTFENNLAMSNDVSGGAYVSDYVDYANDDNSVKYYNVNYPGAGGAIYATHQLSATNTIFANNEALDLLYEKDPQKYYLLNLQAAVSSTDYTGGSEYITVLGGSGGAVFMGHAGFFHFANCNFVRNQANAFPAVYTMNPNTEAQIEDNVASSAYNQFVNTVIWGNDVNSTMLSKYSSDSYPGYRFATQLISNYGKKDRTESYAVTAESEELPSSQEDLDENFQGMAWFSAYEDGHGITTDNTVDLRDQDFNSTSHIAYQIAQMTTSSTTQNCNITISSENSSSEGPHFTSPSATAGNDGYLESADWSPARLNNLTDNGSGKISQTITRAEDSSSYTATFNTNDDGTYEVTGIYQLLRYAENSPQYNANVPLGTDDYMWLSYSTGDDSDNLYRISYDPNPSQNSTYIDIGVYEYPHTELSTDDDVSGVDILWVSNTEKTENGLPDGSSWNQPTSDLQRAIETLLCTRNGKRKEIRLMDGTFTPIYTIDNMMAFYIDTERLNNSAIIEDTGLGVQSLTIKGGYSSELNGVYDVDEYPAVIRQQKRTADNSTLWDHLIYIDDPLQRYGADEYNTNNGYGTYISESDKTVNTFSIEIDGVTLINDQALAGVQGSVIYYKDIDDDTVTSPTSVTVTIDTSSDDDDTSSTTTTATLSGQAKFVLCKSTILGSGNSEDTYESTTYPSAIYLGKNGGYALLYNNIMHSNYGNPILAKCQTLTTNNTYAHNYGLVKLDATGSTIHNSALWKNNPSTTSTSGYGEQFELTGITNDATSLSSSDANYLFSHNSYTGCLPVDDYVSVTDYSSGTSTIATYNYNTILSDDNDDVTRGPHFSDPDNEDVESRSFATLPSLRLLNKGSDDRYVKLPSSDAEDKSTITLSVTSTISDDADDAYKVYDFAYEPTALYDAASNSRFYSTIDLGAYEYQSTLRRVQYVNPNIMTSDEGSSWSNPFGYGEIQDAIDLAALYHVDNTSKEAYVLVKGYDALYNILYTNETLTMRNGVSVYGGIDPLYATDCEYLDEDGEEKSDADDIIAEYIRDVKDGIYSYVGPKAYKTITNGINTSSYTVYDTDTDNDIVSVIDGFHVTATTDENTSGTVTSPLIDVSPTTDDAKVALRHIVVYGNDISATSGVNIANVDNALVYESLFRDNKVSDTGAVLELGPNGYALNITAAGKTVGADDTYGLNGASSSTGSHVYSSLVNYADDDATAYTLSSTHYALSDEDLNYQLEEGSTHIDACNQEDDAYNPTVILPKRLQTFVDYSSDRDLLGNPRLLTNISTSAKVDRGAFETWKVENSTAVETSTDDHFYPHDGSMVYLMEGSDLVCGTDITPGFLLVKEGASLYGVGNEVNVAYAAVERTVNNDGAIVSMPYDMTYGTGSAIPSYDEETGVLTLTANSNDAVYKYDGSERANWNYIFQASNSGLWDAIDSDDEVESNNGVLYVPATTSSSTYRFTAQGGSMTDYIYAETADEQYKTVELTQNDDRESASGGADFTSSEDMGWNCFGLPYLVSDYLTYNHDYVPTDESDESVLYNMHVPHTLWLYYNGTYKADGTTEVDGNGGYYSVSSWDSSDWGLPDTDRARIWVGEGIFTQTSAVNDTETLTFYRPVYSDSEDNSESKDMTRSNTRYHSEGGVIEEEMTVSDFRISANGHVISVIGLEGGERVVIYDSAGRMVSSETSPGETYSTNVASRGVYIVKVDNARKKVLIR